MKQLPKALTTVYDNTLIFRLPSSLTTDRVRQIDYQVNTLITSLLNELPTK